ncbi:MAG TPA: DUF348 domain-containing protein [Thermoanaerobacterales bacterium]|nr:DUF348 domain-containing protein [Thermoanaerobacterales bacterium]
MEDNPSLIRAQEKAKRSLLVPLILGAIIALIILGGAYFYSQKQVTIIEGDKVLEVKTFKKDVKSVLDEAGIILDSNDVVEPELEAMVKKGMEIEIARAIPVIVEIDGEQIAVMTAKTTVQEVLEKEEFELNETDKVEPGLDEEIQPNMNIKVVRITHELVEDTKKIPYKLIRKKNESLEKGVTRVIQQGKEGIVEVTYKVIYEDGEEVDRLIMSENTVSEPQDKIEEYGTVDFFTTSRGEKLRFTKVLDMTATAYDAGVKSTGKTPDHPQYGITSTGVKVRKGIASVDPKTIPLGSRLYVTGYGPALAADTGSAIKGNRIDLYHETYEEAMRFGRKKVKVYILDE